jgi:hypothetical protein
MSLLKHGNSRKTSSKAAAFMAELRSLETPEAVQAKVRSTPSKELGPILLDAIAEGRIGADRVKLVEIANLHDDGCSRFWHQWGPIYYAFLSDAELLEIRDEVRAIWDPGEPDAEKQRILDAWLSYRLGWPSVKYGSDSPIWVDWRYRRVLPNPFNLRAGLAIALVENASRLAHCTNPECAAPYFLAKRRSQKFCERGECTSFAQRQYSLAWWNAKGKQKRAKKASKKKTKN